MSGRGNIGYAELTGRERFELCPLIYADVGVLSEYRATIRNVDKSKRLFGGEKVPVEQKNRGNTIITRKPVFVTAQTGWDGWLGQADRTAILNRLFYYKLMVPLPDAPVFLCSCYWKHLQEQWLRQC